MNKYSEMSDFEVNIAVIDALYPNNQYQFNNYPNGSTVCAWEGDGSGDQEYFDYCEDFAQSVQLMISNKISLEYQDKNWLASTKGIFDFKIFVKNKNPCRAIAECYLLLKDAEKNNG